MNIPMLFSKISLDVKFFYKSIIHYCSDKNFEKLLEVSQLNYVNKR